MPRGPCGIEMRMGTVPMRESVSYGPPRVHFYIGDFLNIKKYDHIFIIIPKGKLNLSAEGTKIGNQLNPASDLLNSNIIEELKKQIMLHLMLL